MSTASKSEEVLKESRYTTHPDRTNLRFGLHHSLTDLFKSGKLSVLS